MVRTHEKKLSTEVSISKFAVGEQCSMEKEISLSYALNWRGNKNCKDELLVLLKL